MHLNTLFNTVQYGSKERKLSRVCGWIDTQLAYASTQAQMLTCEFIPMQNKYITRLHSCQIKGTLKRERRFGRKLGACYRI